MTGRDRRRPVRRAPRGHLLVEAMVSGTVFLVAVSSLLGAIGAAQQRMADAALDQRAWHELRQRYEVQRAASKASADWALGTRTGTVSTALDPVPWTWTVVVSQEADAAVAGGGPLAYRKAVVGLSYRGKAIRLEALKW